MTARQDTSLPDVERGIDLRKTRQRILGREHPPDVCALIDEGALRRIAGWPDIMIEQYEHLILAATEPNLTLQIIPLSGGVYPAGGFSFTLLGFSDPADPKIAYAELLTSDHYTDNAEHVGRHQAEFEQLRGRALDPAASVAFLRAHASHLGG
jgi:hypothetical protein